MNDNGFVQIYKVPATDVEALKSTLMGLFEKRRARKFFIYVQDYEENDPKSHEGLDLNKVTARDVISYISFSSSSPFPLADFLLYTISPYRLTFYLPLLYQLENLPKKI